MKQIKLNEVTAALKSFVRADETSHQFRTANRVHGYSKKRGYDVTEHRSGDMEILAKGKVIGYWWDSLEWGMAFANPKSFEAALKVANNPDAQPVKVARATRTAASSDEHMGKTAGKTTRGKAASASASDTGGRKRRTPVDAEATKPTRQRKAAATSDAEPDLTLHVSDDNSPVENAQEVFKVLQSEIKRLGVTSGNVRDLLKALKSYLNEAA